MDRKFHDDGGHEMQHRGEATSALTDLGRGDASAVQRLLPLVYDELRALAGAFFRHQQPDHTLQPTALVHEAFFRLVDQTSVEWKDRAHFFAVAATAMRQILTDHARRRRAAKRGGHMQRITLDAAITPPTEMQIDLIVLDDALAELAGLDERRHQVVVMRFFGGLTVEEVARVLNVSKTTTEDDWRVARAWLGVRLERGEPGES